jgi:hypothetical protein
VKRMVSEWTTYRTRFLIRAKQLDEPLTFVDCIGREHSGQVGDYLVLSSDGSRRIAPREIFEDIYVPMDQSAEPWPLVAEIVTSSRVVQPPERAQSALPGSPPSQSPPSTALQQAVRRRAGGGFFVA